MNISMLSNQDQNIIIADTPQYAQEACITLQSRILIFEQKPEKFFVNFMPQKFTSCSIFIIPAGHFYFLKAGACNRFLCIDIAHNVLDDWFKTMLYRWTFFQNKGITAVEDDTYNYSSLKHISAELILEQLEQCIRKRVSYIYQYQEECLNTKHIHCIDSLIKYLSINEAKIATYNVNTVANVIACDRKFLNTACHLLFGCSTLSVLQWYLLQRSFLLMTHAHESINSIAKTLGFSDPSTFRKFLKKQTFCSPSELREFANLAYKENKE